MRRRPLSLIAASFLFLYFPFEFALRWWQGDPFNGFEFVLAVVLPFVLLFGLLRVSRVGWYTMVALVALWGVDDLAQYYFRTSGDIGPLLIHLGIYLFSLAYFINPRVRHLYFDPKARWWRTKPRYETHLPMVVNQNGQWSYPILRNVSEGGCFIETPHLADANSSLDLCIPLPFPLGVSTIQARGEVRWTSRNPLRHGMGIQFKDPAPEQARAIAEYVARQL